LGNEKGKVRPKKGVGHGDGDCEQWEFEEIELNLEASFGASGT